jgi:hypothetical protein
VESSEVIDINNDCRTSQEGPFDNEIMEVQREDDDLQQLVENQVSVDSWEATQEEPLANEIIEISIQRIGTSKDEKVAATIT